METVLRQEKLPKHRCPKTK